MTKLIWKMYVTKIAISTTTFIMKVKNQSTVNTLVNVYVDLLVFTRIAGTS